MSELEFPTIRIRLRGLKIIEVVVFSWGPHAQMTIVATNHAELVRVGSKLSFHFQADLECRAGVLILEHVLGLRPGGIVHIAEVPDFEVGEFIVW